MKIKMPKKLVSFSSYFNLIEYEIYFQGEIDDDDDMIADDDGCNPNDVKLKASKLAAAVATEAEAAAADKDAEEVLNEFNFLSNPDGVDGKSQDEG